MGAESRSVVVRLSLDTAQAIRESKQFGAEFDAAMAKAEKRSASTSTSIDKIGSTAGKTALVAGAALTAIVATTANFDEAMSHVAATGNDARQSIDQLREAAIDAGQSTAFSASEAAAGIENLAKAGVSAKDILGGGLKGSLDLAAAGGMEVADAAEVAATALTQFKLSGSDVPHVADLLAAAAGKAQGDVSDMSMALKQSGLVASQMGLSLEETTGTLAAFASAGLIGSDAGTSFRTMLLRLANPTKQSAELMASLGIEAYDAQGNFVGMASVAEQLSSALGTKTQAERDSAMATIFGSDAIRAASVLYDQGAKGIDAWTTKVDDSGYAAETAAVRMDNLKGDVEQLKGSLETAFIGAGEGSQGALRDLVQGATDAVNAFNKMPAPLQGTVTKLLAITAVTGGALWFGSKVISGISNTRDALENLGASGTRASKALRAVGVASAALATLTVASAAIDEFEQSTTRAVPGVDALTKSILALGNAQAGQNLRKELGDVAGAMDTLDDKGFWGKLDALSGKVPLGLGNLGHAASPLFSIGLSNAASDADDATASIEALDKAMANIVQTGSPEQAAAAFDDLAEAYGLTAAQQEQLLGHLPAYQAALDGVSNAASLAVGATDDLGVASRQSAQASMSEADAINAATKAMHDKTSAALAGFDAETQYRQALKDAREQAEKSSAGIRGNSDEVLANRSALSGLASAWNNQSDAVKNNLGRFQEARKSFIDTATAMGVPRAQARALAREYLDIPKSVVTKVSAEVAPALSAIARIKAEMATIPRNLRTDYYVNQINSANKPNALERATGGPIYGPGTKTSDSIPVMASRGEFMMSAAAVDHYGVDTMFKMNARRLAGGGDVAGRTATFDSTGTGVPVGPGIRGAMDALVEMRGIVKHLTGTFRDAEKAVRTETHERDQLATKLDREQAKLDKIQAKFDDLEDAITGGLTSDAFAGLTSKNPWQSAGGIGSVIATLTQDTANATAFDGVQAQLAQSLKGGALQAVLEQGLSAAQTFAAGSPEQLAAYQAAYDARTAGVASTAKSGAGSVFGAALAGQTDVRDQVKAELKESNASLRALEKAAEREEKLLDRANDTLDDIRDTARERKQDANKHAAESNRQAEKNRGAAQGGQRDRRYARNG